MYHERDVSGEMEQISDFLSGITGLNVTNIKNFPELKLSPNISESDHGVAKQEIPFTYHLALGRKGDQYTIDFAMVFTDDWTPGRWLPNVKWTVSYNGDEIFNVGGMVCTSKVLRHTDFGNRQKVESLLVDELKHHVGGPDTEVPFMDYESYSLASLKKENSYFENIYLVLMTHMKERGLQLPPILSKREYIKGPMLAGDVNTVNQILSSLLSFESQNFATNIQAHMKAEAQAIKEHTLWEAKKKDPTVPLEVAFPHTKVTKIEKGNSIFPGYTILAVENDLRNYGAFSQTIARSLDADARYKGSKVITEYNLHACMQLCASDRVDVILFDWTNPSHEEVLMVRHEDPNPFYQMYHGSAQAVLTIDDEGIVASTQDGKLLDAKAMKEESERIDIRNEWMNMIKAACAKSGVQAPPCFIVRSGAELQDLAKIVCQKLGKSIS